MPSGRFLGTRGIKDLNSRDLGKKFAIRYMLKGLSDLGKHADREATEKPQNGLRSPTHTTELE